MISLVYPNVMEKSRRREKFFVPGGLHIKIELFIIVIILDDLGNNEGIFIILYLPSY